MSTPSDMRPPIRFAPPAPGESHERGAAAAARRPAGTLHHWTFLALSLGVVTASALLSVREGRYVVVPGLNRALPGTCTFLRVTGLPCPGCGLTRSFISTAHGQLREAWRYNPAGMLFFVVVLFQIPYRAWQICRLRRGQDEHHFTSFDHWTIVALVCLMLVQWLCVLVLRG